MGVAGAVGVGEALVGALVGWVAAATKMVTVEPLGAVVPLVGCCWNTVPGVVPAGPANATPGNVFQQNPAAGSSLASGSTVTIYVAATPTPTQTPTTPTPTVTASTPTSGASS